MASAGGAADDFARGQHETGCQGCWHFTDISHKPNGFNCTVLHSRTERRICNGKTEDGLAVGRYPAFYLCLLRPLRLKERLLFFVPSFASVKGLLPDLRLFEQPEISGPARVDSGLNVTLGWGRQDFVASRSRLPRTVKKFLSLRSMIFLSSNGSRHACSWRSLVLMASSISGLSSNR